MLPSDNSQKNSRGSFGFCFSLLYFTSLFSHRNTERQSALYFFLQTHSFPLLLLSDRHGQFLLWKELLTPFLDFKLEIFLKMQAIWIFMCNFWLIFLEHVVALNWDKTRMEARENHWGDKPILKLWVDPKDDLNGF